MEIEAENMPAPGAGFAAQVAEIEALKVFSRALPVWVAKHGTSVSVSFFATEEGVMINLGLPEHATPQMADDVIATLRDAERMSQLELLVDQMRNVGVAPEVLDPMIKEAEDLAQRLFPKNSNPSK